MSRQELLETQRALSSHLKGLRRTLEKHMMRQPTWEDRGLGSWEEAHHRLVGRIEVTEKVLQETVDKVTS